MTRLALAALAVVAVAVAARWAALDRDLSVSSLELGEWPK